MNKRKIKQSDSITSFLSNGLLPTLERGIQPPIEEDCNPFLGEDIQKLKQIVAKALENISFDSDKLNIALKLMGYVCGELRFGLQCGFTCGSAVFSASPGVTCAAFAKALVALSRSAGIPGREASFSALSTCIGHTVCELWINGRWICMDPRYGLLFLNNNYWDSNALLSFQQLIDYPESEWFMFKVLDFPCQGRDLKTKSGLPEKVNTCCSHEQFFTSDLESFYRNIVATAYPVTYRSTATCFPLIMDFRQKKRCEFFAFDPFRSEKKNYLGFGVGNGSRSLGYAFMNMLWFHNPGSDLIKLTITFKDLAPDLQCLPLAYLRVIRRIQLSIRQIKFIFRSTAVESMVLLYAPESFGVLDHVCAELAGSKIRGQ